MVPVTSLFNAKALEITQRRASHLLKALKSQAGTLTDRSPAVPFALRAALRRSHNQPTPQLSTAFNALTHHTLPGFAASIHTSSPRSISGAMSPSAVSNTSNDTAGAPKQNAWVGHLGAAGFDLRSE